MTGDVPIRLVVVDDHPVFRMGMVALLASIDGLEVIGEAAAPRTAIDTVVELEPELVLQLHLPVVSPR